MRHTTRDPMTCAYAFHSISDTLSPCLTAGGGQVPDEAAPLATMRHWLTGRCAGTSVAIRKEVAEGMKDIFKAVKGMKGEGAKEARELRKVTNSISACPWLRFEISAQGEVKGDRYR